MKLYWSSRSPYVRKVMIAAHETGQANGIECKRVAVSAFLANTDMLSANPLGKIPTLIAEGGEPLYDSRVICEYLDTLHSGTPLYPPSGAERFVALRRQALGDGILDMLIQRLYEERMREEAQRSETLLTAIKGKLHASLNALDLSADSLANAPFNIGQIAIGTALSYLDFRFDADDWRAGRERLAGWHAEFRHRPSVLATEFVDVR